MFSHVFFIVNCRRNFNFNRRQTNRTLYSKKVYLNCLYKDCKSKYLYIYLPKTVISTKDESFDTSPMFPSHWYLPDCLTVEFVTSNRSKAIFVYRLEGDRSMDLPFLIHSKLSILSKSISFCQEHVMLKSWPTRTYSKIDVVVRSGKAVKREWNIVRIFCTSTVASSKGSGDGEGWVWPVLPLA